MAERTSSPQLQSFGTSPFPPTALATAPAAPIIEPTRNAPALPPRDPMKITLPAAPGVTQPFNNNDKFHSDANYGDSNIFQNNPFEIPSTKADPFGMTAFDNNADPFSKAFSSDDWSMAQKSVPVHTLSLDELDPLKK